MSKTGKRHASEVRAITDAQTDRLADTMFALSSPTRVLILGCLLDRPRSVSDLTESLGMEQSAVSHQLRVLREHDLVRGEKIGRLRLYALYDEQVATFLYAALDHLQCDHRASKAATRRHFAADQGAEGRS